MPDIPDKIYYELAMWGALVCMGRLVDRRCRFVAISQRSKPGLL